MVSLINLIGKILNPFKIYLKSQPTISGVDSELVNEKNKNIFTNIYKNKQWGGSDDLKFYSGSGSHQSEIVNSYTTAVKNYFSNLNHLTAVDLGCGDFNIGSKIYYLFSSYTACDIVDDLISFNKSKFPNKNLHFKCLDAVEDELPSGNVVFIRQVLQHLSNTDIKKVVRKIEKKYDYAVITEHLPSDNFIPNLDKPSGPNIRLIFESGVVLNEAPFNIRHSASTCICEINEYGGIIRTTVYKIN
jgi:hypothetical protein